MIDELKQLREKVDRVDDQILNALKERAAICRSIGSLKKKNGIPVKDILREGEIFERIREKAKGFSLDPEQVEAVFREIVIMCSAVQE